jgi:hypothetical protein
MQHNSKDTAKMPEKLSIDYKTFYKWVTVDYKKYCPILRSKKRVIKYNEVFTGLDHVMLGLSKYDEQKFLDKTISFCDNCAGEGIWLVGIALKRMQLGMSHRDAVKNLKAVELLPDNRNAIITRLMCKDETLRNELEKNIVQADSLSYHYRWDGSDPSKSNEDIIFDKFFY